MKLDPELESMLAGESGNAAALALETLVEYGKNFGAQRMLPIKSAHLAGTFGIVTYKAYYKILDQLVKDGLKVKVPTTTNPRPGADFNFPNRIAFIRQKKLESSFEALGVTPNFSCACYEGSNEPNLGDAVAWAESSAVQFANSALGARTNRHSLLIDACGAVTGVTPEFGYMLDENRRGKILVKLDVDKMDPSALGFIIGREVVDMVPVVENFDIDRVGLKNMGGAMAAAGAVALFHIEGVTPEAPDMKSAFDGEPEKTITITQKDLDSLRSAEPEKADVVIFGCPHMTLDEATEIAGYFEGKRSKKPVRFCMIPSHLEKFTKTDSYGRALAAGIEFYTHCPLAAYTVQLGRKRILTSSGKLYYYLDGTEYGNLEDCLKACGV